MADQEWSCVLRINSLPTSHLPQHGSTLEAAITAADALGYDNVCIGEDNGDIVVGKDVGPSGGPRELEGDVISKVGDSISIS